MQPRQWWWSQRWRYNKGLLIAGFIAFVLYCSLGPFIIEPHEEFEETIFEMAFQGFGYLIMMAIANIFYTLGWIIDISFNTSNSQIFRVRLFSFGIGFLFHYQFS